VESCPVATPANRSTVPSPGAAFVRAVVHDLKAPASGIQTHIDLLIEDEGGSLAPETQERLRLLQALARRIGRQVDGLGRLYRVTTGGLVRREVDLAEEAARAAYAVAWPPDTRVQGADTLPRVSGDPILLRSVFTELLANAAIFRGDTPLRIEMGCRPDGPGDTVIGDSARPALFIRDNGIGIPGKFHEQVFGMFERLHGPGVRGEGVGAGLAVARSIVELHGGRIWIESSPTGGCTVTFTLPSGDGS
jgi:two-component system, chemotaxis family, sensor kinase Cph1